MLNRCWPELGRRFIYQQAGIATTANVLPAIIERNEHVVNFLFQQRIHVVWSPAAYRRWFSNPWICWVALDRIRHHCTYQAAYLVSYLRTRLLITDDIDVDTKGCSGPSVACTGLCNPWNPFKPSPKSVGIPEHGLGTSKTQKTRSLLMF